MFDKSKQNIINSHMHLGTCRVFDVTISKDEFLNNMEENKVDQCIVQVFPGVEDYKKGHDEIIELCKENQDIVYGLISINPHLPQKEFNYEVDRLMDTGYFKAIKLHTIGHAVNPLSRDADKIYKVAKKYEIPVMIHTGAGIPFALPSIIIPKAKQYQDVDFILAHSGMAQIYSTEAIIAAQICNNICLETSWTSIDDKNLFVNILGSEKVIFGSDMPSNTSTELFQFKELNLFDKDLKNIMELNSKKVFKI